MSMDSRGKPVNVQLHALSMTSDSQELARTFIDVSIAATKRWKFKPERVNGIAVSSRVIVPINFSIDDMPKAPWKLVILPTPVSDAKLRAAIEKLKLNTRRPIAIENATGLELITDGSKS